LVISHKTSKQKSVLSQESKALYRAAKHKPMIPPVLQHAHSLALLPSGGAGAGR
jgi:hypothetical protein